MRITEYKEETSHAMFHQQGYDEGFDKRRRVGEARGEERGLIRGIAGLVKNGVVALWKVLVWIIRGWLDWFYC